MQPKNCSKLLSPCEGVDLLNRSSLRGNISSWPLCRERRIHTVTRNTLLWIRRRGLMGPPQRRSHLPCSKEYRRELSAEDFRITFKLYGCCAFTWWHERWELSAWRPRRGWHSCLFKPNRTVGHGVPYSVRRAPPAPLNKPFKPPQKNLNTH